MMRFTLPGFRAPHARTGLVGGACATVALAATACSSTTPSDHSVSDGHAGSVTISASTVAPTASPSPRGSATAGSIRITGAYLPQPATADVAAAYFTIADTGDQADTLISATSAPAAQAMLMTESTAGGAESMTALTGGLPIPAHGQVTLTPGGYHLMLTDPATPLEQGGTVVLTLHFEHAGTVTLKVPVTSLLSDALAGPAPTGGASSTAGTPGMTGTPGMPGMPGM
jgi:copper(I)-binding protein